MALANQPIKFLQGPQEALNGLITNGGAVEGSFYLTNDTHRLYVGKTVGEKTVPVAVNEGVTTVANIAALPTSGVNAGEFYYATTENILCVYNGSQFIQINTDSNTTLKSFVTVAEVIADNGGVKVTQTIEDTNKDKYTDSFTIKDSGKANIVSVGTDTDGNPVIDIKGDKYSFGKNVTNNVATISLTSENGVIDTTGKNTIKVEAGDNVTIAQNATNDGFVIASSYENTKIKANPDGVKLEYDGFTEAGTGVLKLTIKDTSDDTYTAQIDLGKYYTEAEIDSKFRDLNGMKYVGTVGNTALPTSKVKSGYTYMVDKDLFVVNDDITANTGDLLIATGTEDTEGENNGYLTTIVWTHIPSGDDTHTDTTYNLTNLAHGKDLHNNNANESAGKWQLQAGTAIDLIDNPDAGTVNADGENELTIQVKHADVAHTQNPGDDAISVGTDLTTITAVSGVTVNDQGHVTDVSYSTYGIKDSTYELSGATVAVAEGGKSLTITDSLKNTSNNDAAGTSVTSITSDSLTFKAVEGNPAAYNVEITWGSFGVTE